LGNEKGRRKRKRTGYSSRFGVEKKDDAAEEKDLGVFMAKCFDAYAMGSGHRC
jgi:hypothetical protein